MKYKLETIPVWDAFEKGSECPFCLLEREAEERYVDFFLGSSVMAPEMRVQVNAAGFCRSHYPMLFETRKNRHSLGLVTHTRFREAAAGKEKLLTGVLRKAGGTRGAKALQDAAGFFEAEAERCMICDRIGETIGRYLYTAVYLWKKDEEGFRERYAASKGACLRHLPGLLRMAAELLPAALRRAWLEATLELERKNDARLEAELLWYTRKFDFQNDGEPWGDSRDALERVIGKLIGRIIG